MDGPEPVPGWEAEMHHAMHQMPLLAGVPLEIAVFTFLGGALLFLIWWPLSLFAALVYGVAWIGTQLEPRWMGMLLDWWDTKGEYEG